jgi:hypothetical protein
LKSGNPDVWDSGKQTSADSVGIAYAGRALQSRKRYYWTVKVWDAAGQESQSSEDAWWETGLLHKSDWSAKWIARKNPEAAADRDGIRWIWTPGQDAPNVKPKAVVSAERRHVWIAAPGSLASASATDYADHMEAEGGRLRCRLKPV